MPIMVTRSSLPPFEEYCEEIRKLWDSHWLTNMGTEHETLELMLREYLGCPEVVLYTNGHLALENVLAAFGFPEGAEVITTPFTFVSTTHAVVRSGLTPVFCDVDPVTYTLDPGKIEERITPKTAAVLPVHVYGHFCDTDTIGKIAEKHGLKVIYDAAHAFGESRYGRSAACFGDASMFSFHATKVFNTIEGGAVCTADPHLAEILCDMKNFGIRNAESCVYAGGNAKMNEFQAAMGICNLRHLEEEIGKRKRAALRYRRNLGGRKDLAVSAEQEGVNSNYSYFPVVFPEREERDRVFEKLKENGILARKYFYPLTCDAECYAGRPGFDRKLTPTAAYLADRVLTLPMYADLLPEEVDRICELI